MHLRGKVAQSSTGVGVFAQIKRFRDEFIDKLSSDLYLMFTAKRNMETIRFLDSIGKV
jgi:hypothetical protein